MNPTPQTLDTEWKDIPVGKQVLIGNQVCDVREDYLGKYAVPQGTPEHLPSVTIERPSDAHRIYKLLVAA